MPSRSFEIEWKNTLCICWVNNEHHHFSESQLSFCNTNGQRNVTNDANNISGVLIKLEPWEWEWAWDREWQQNRWTENRAQRRTRKIKRTKSTTVATEAITNEIFLHVTVVVLTRVNWIIPALTNLCQVWTLWLLPCCCAFTALLSININTNKRSSSCSLQSWQKLKRSFCVNII